MSLQSAREDLCMLLNQCDECEYIKEHKAASQTNKGFAVPARMCVGCKHHERILEKRAEVEALQKDRRKAKGLAVNEMDSLFELPPTVVKNKELHREIRKDYRECLKRFNRPELVSTYSGVPINSDALVDKMILYACYKNEQLVEMILDRDVENTVQYLEQGRKKR